MTRTLTTILALSLIGCGAPTQDNSGNEVNDINVTLVGSQDEALDDVSYEHFDDPIWDYMNANAIRGCGAGFALDGEVVYLKGYGWQDYDAEILWDVETVAPVGSVSKTLTAIGIMRLQEMGELSVTDTLDTALPGAPLFPTIEELLLHTSRMGGANKDEAYAPSFAGYDPNLYADPNWMRHPRLAYDAWGPNELGFALPDGTVPSDPAGQLTTGVYSNVGYTALGAVIDELTHDDPAGWADGYERFLWTEVGRGTLLADGGMATMALMHSFRTNDIPNLAPGYDANHVAEPWPNTGSVEGWEGPAGGWAMTIGDLTRLAAAIQQREILAQSSWNAMMTPQSWVLVGPYGYGMWVEPMANWDSYWHGGDSPTGGAAVWSVYENLANGKPDLSVAIMCNGGLAIDLEDIADEIMVSYYSSLIDEPDVEDALPPVGTRDIHGKTFELDFSEAHTDLFAIDPGQLRPDLTLSVLTGWGYLALTLSETGSTGFSDVNWSWVPFSDPGFVTGDAWVSIPTESYGTLVLEDAQLTGEFGAHGDTLENASLSGLWDTRSISLPLDYCTMAADKGTSCEPCADGLDYCLPITLSGISGTVTP